MRSRRRLGSKPKVPQYTPLLDFAGRVGLLLRRDENVFRVTRRELPSHPTGFPIPIVNAWPIKRKSHVIVEQECFKRILFEVGLALIASGTVAVLAYNNFS